MDVQRREREIQAAAGFICSYVPVGSGEKGYDVGRVTCEEKRALPDLWFRTKNEARRVAGGGGRDDGGGGKQDRLGVIADTHTASKI